MTRTLLIVIGIVCTGMMVAGCAPQQPVETPQDTTLQYELDPELTFKLELNYAIPLLADLYDKKDTIQIRNLLKNTNKAVRILSIQTLTKLNDKESIPEIKKLLRDREEIVRDTAEHCLRALGVPEKEIEEAKEKK